jgi:tetratricopeptide (TPR) repeat protein
VPGRHGQGVAPDLPASIRWHEHAAELDVPDSLMELGFAYLHAECGVTQDVNRACAFFVRAAEAGRPEALRNASQAAAALGQFGDAEQFAKTVSESVPGLEAEWFLFCRRYERGDLASARKFLEAKLQVMQRPVRGPQAAALAAYLLATNRFDEAHDALAEAFAHKRDSFYGLELLLLARDADERRAIRDALRKTASAASVKVAELLHDASAQGVLDPAAVLALAKEVGPGDALMVDGMAGRWFESHGKKDEARACYERVVTSAMKDRFLTALARDGLARVSPRK